MRSIVHSLPATLALSTLLAVAGAGQTSTVPTKEPVVVAQYGGIRVQGSKDFAGRTCAALKLLKSTPYLARVQRDIKLIEEGERSGARPYDKVPSYEVGKRTWQAQPIWYASTIVHDAYHAHLYHAARKRDGAVPDSAWTGAEAEKKCLKVQLDALAALHADKRTMDYVRGLLKNPTYQGNASSWSDYKKRNW